MSDPMDEPDYAENVELANAAAARSRERYESAEETPLELDPAAIIATTDQGVFMYDASLEGPPEEDALLRASCMRANFMAILCTLKSAAIRIQEDAGRIEVLCSRAETAEAELARIAGSN